MTADILPKIVMDRQNGLGDGQGACFADHTNRRADHQNTSQVPNLQEWFAVYSNETRKKNSWEGPKIHLRE